MAVNSSGESVPSNQASATTNLISYTYNVGKYPHGIAIDASGNVWVANHNTSIVTEIMGITAGPQYFPCLGVGCPVFQGGGNL